MPKILHVLSQIPAHTGSGIFFQNVIKQCASQDYTQAAIIGVPATFDQQPLEHLSPSTTYTVSFETDALPFKVPGMSDVMPYESTVFSEMTSAQLHLYTDAFKTTFAHVLKTFKPDVILAHHLWLATATLGDYLHDLLQNDPNTFYKPKLFALCHGTDLRQLQLCPHLVETVVQGCQKVDGVFTISMQQNAIIGEHYGLEAHKIHLVGGGYDATVFHPSHAAADEPPARSKKIELVYAGKLAQSKGLFELIHAMEKLDSLKYRLRIAGNGSGPEAESIHHAIANTSADIQYLGQLSQPELAQLFRDSDVFVLPSYYEGLSLVTVEALACGMKIVVNTLSGLHDWLGDLINQSGNVFYVNMPELLGPDVCSPNSEATYVYELAHTLETCAQSMQSTPALTEAPPLPLDAYYRAIEEKSWANVLGRMEVAFRAEGVNLSKP